MNLFLIAFLLLLAPAILQIICGNMAVRKRIRLPFELVCAIAVLVQLISIFVAVKLVLIDLGNRDVHCGLPTAVMFFWGLATAVILLLVIVIQVLWRKFRKP
jgi:succinate dehydrogenase/fumarate reductase cytochrome b subunit